MAAAAHRMVQAAGAEELGVDAAQRGIGHMMALHNCMEQHEGCCRDMNLEDWHSQHATHLCSAAFAVVAQAVTTTWLDPTRDGRLIQALFPAMGRSYDG